ncbi:MAG: hypothetical protein J0G32_02535 [Alphaproteobacteria bacterium]|nr:hypothetical protein [Alphaproteobacteria bacterium]OJV12171.1 MAG: hypothetical protein BGO27_05475 [Alphaproteobacteria bacterium 33-17]
MKLSDYIGKNDIDGLSGFIRSGMFNSMDREEINDALLKAFESINVDEIELVLQLMPNPNLVTKTGYPLLAIASSQPDSRLLILLLSQKNIKINFAPNGDQTKTALYCAEALGLTENVSIIKEALKEKHESPHKNWRDDDYKSNKSQSL